MTSRTALIAGNWKMYKTGGEAAETARRLLDLVKDVRDRDIMIAPPFTALSQVSQVVSGTPVGLGAQNLYWEKEGAFTGEISPGMLTAAGCQYAIIGHSERRQFFGETDETVNQKIRAANANNLTPVFCIGESEQERESNLTFSVLDKQVQSGLQGFASGDLEKLVIAYEPVWAIGTGKTATKEQAQEAHQYIRSLVKTDFGDALSGAVRILYGGSVKPDNVTALMAQPDVDGALVGGASLDPESFARIIRAA